MTPRLVVGLGCPCKSYVPKPGGRTLLGPFTIFRSRGSGKIAIAITRARNSAIHCERNITTVFRNATHARDIQERAGPFFLELEIPPYTGLNALQGSARPAVRI
jgi:hypothetical protein